MNKVFITLLLLVSMSALSGCTAPTENDTDTSAEATTTTEKASLGSPEALKAENEKNSGHYSNAVENKSTDKCNEITDVSLKKRCVQDATNEKAAASRDKSECDSLSTESEIVTCKARVQKEIDAEQAASQ